MRARLIFVFALLLGAIAMSALASSTGRRVVGDCTKSQVHPATIVIACADANLSLTHLHWSSFGGPSASATGRYYVNDCTPNCAAGRFHSYPIRLVLSKAKPCQDHFDDYRRADITFTAARPPGQKSATSRQALFCPLPG
jgi:hypothetical protein